MFPGRALTTKTRRHKGTKCFIYFNGCDFVTLWLMLFPENISDPESAGARSGALLVLVCVCALAPFLTCSIVCKVAKM
jgi:hypothetical protein